MEILTGIGDFLVRITPLIVGLLLYIVPTAKDRLDRKYKAQEAPVIQQGKTVDYTEEYVNLLRDKLSDADEIDRLQRLLDKHGIPYDSDGKED